MTQEKCLFEVNRAQTDVFQLLIDSFVDANCNPTPISERANRHGWVYVPSPIAASWLLFQTLEVSAHLLL